MIHTLMQMHMHMHTHADIEPEHRSRDVCSRSWGQCLPRAVVLMHKWRPAW